MLTYFTFAPSLLSLDIFFNVYWHIFTRKFLVNCIFPLSTESLVFGGTRVSVGVGFAAVLSSFLSCLAFSSSRNIKKSHSQLNFIFSNFLTKPSLFHIIFISSLPATWKANTWLLFWQNGSITATLHNVHKKTHTWEKFTHRKIHMMNLQVAPLPLSHLYPILFSPAR